MWKDTMLTGNNYWAVRESAEIMCTKKLFKQFWIGRDATGRFWTAVMVPNR